MRKSDRSATLACGSRCVGGKRVPSACTFRAQRNAARRGTPPLEIAGCAKEFAPLDYKFSTPEDAGRIVADLSEKRADVTRGCDVGVKEPLVVAIGREDRP